MSCFAIDIYGNMQVKGGEQLAEILLVSGRTVSRWETETNMPALLRQPPLRLDFLFGKDSEYLQDLISLFQNQNHRAMALWAFDFAAESIAVLEEP